MADDLVQGVGAQGGELAEGVGPLDETLSGPGDAFSFRRVS
jgi:hypothetical protein